MGDRDHYVLYAEYPAVAPNPGAAAAAGLLAGTGAVLVGLTAYLAARLI